MIELIEATESLVNIGREISWDDFDRGDRGDASTKQQRITIISQRNWLV